MSTHILVVDDEKELADVLELYLVNDGCTIHKCYTGAEALDCLAHTDLDLALLDVMLPDADGFQLRKKIREKSYCPTIMEIAPAQINDYYSVCEARIASLMAMEQPDSPAVQHKAVEMYQKVEKPFEVYPGMSSTILDYQNIMGFLVLLFCVVIAAPVFSADYQSGADDILRCTRNGRARLGIAKLLAALFISAAAFVICAVVHILVVNSLFGWECTKTSIQMLYSIVTLTGMNIGELQRLFAVAGLLSVLASVSFTLFLSSRSKTTVASLASGLVFCIAPVVLSMTVPGAMSTWLCSILPGSGTSIQASILYAITDFKFLSLGGLAVWTLWAMIGAYIIEIPLFAFLAVRSYCRHTVN